MEGPSHTTLGTSSVGSGWTTKEVSDYYYGFCNRIIWPVCHLFQENAQFDREYWETYRKVNDKFAAVAVGRVGR